MPVIVSTRKKRRSADATRNHCRIVRRNNGARLRLRLERPACLHFPFRENLTNPSKKKETNKIT